MQRNLSRSLSVCVFLSVCCERACVCVCVFLAVAFVTVPEGLFESVSSVRQTQLSSSGEQRCEWRRDHPVAFLVISARPLGLVEFTSEPAGGRLNKVCAQCQIEADLVCHVGQQLSVRMAPGSACGAVGNRQHCHRCRRRCRPVCRIRP